MGQHSDVGQHSDERPLVSLVIPVYNSMPYLLETLDAIPGQGLSPAALEVVLVDDGSDDGSERVLAEYTAKNPNYRLLAQPNSGGPADPCNKGVAAARGKYFFVLGSDDVLTPGSLGELAAYAEAEGSDIVLAKMAGLNGRHAPGSMFTKSTADAHLVKDRLFNSLTAIKLFRTDLVTKTGAHNPTHLRIGSDQPFTAACYLVARKISVRADRDYVLIRKRDDGKNVTSTPRTSREYADLLAATVEVIVRWSEPGELRDGVLHRPVHGALRKTLLPRFLDLDEDEQDAVVSEIRGVMTPVFSPRVAGHLGSLDRLKVRLALAGRTDLLRRLIGWEQQGGTDRLVHDENGFRLDLPTDLVASIGPERLRDVKVVGVATLEDLTVEGGVLRLEASAHVRHGVDPPDSVALRLRRRGSEDWFDVPAAPLRIIGRGGARALSFRTHVETGRLDRGIWDLSVLQRSGDDELENRLGRNRSDRVPGDRRRLVDDDAPREIGVAYFTQGYGNLSLDIGFTLQPRTGPEVSLLALLRTGSGARVALLRLITTEPVTLTALLPGASGQAGVELPAVQVGDGVLAVHLPRNRDQEERRIQVEDSLGAAVLRLPEAVEVPGLGSPEEALAAGARAARGLARRAGLRRPHLLSRPALGARR
ncbi:glycosyltransferase [Brachybacterium sacelli]|uniref:CDP-glycerol glycerophosphotransferase n=1 Tax=Brachybacterium sacelli TaxID=173364 RepID=A0ABS4X374_9MICO|nr:CDP-glycerol glycerophosphotransferase [Brachybacterium sacelli]